MYFFFLPTFCFLFFAIEGWKMIALGSLQLCPPGGKCRENRALFQNRCQEPVQNAAIRGKAKDTSQVRKCRSQKLAMPKACWTHSAKICEDVSTKLERVWIRRCFGSRCC